jgi:hypothetical protein
MGGKTTDANSTVLQLDAVKSAERAETHQTGRPDQALLHHDYQRGATGNELRVAAEFFHCGLNFFESLGGAVFERYHGAVLIWRIGVPFGSIR